MQSFGTVGKPTSPFLAKAARPSFDTTKNSSEPQITQITQIMALTKSGVVAGSEMSITTEYCNDFFSCLRIPAIFAIPGFDWTVDCASGCPEGHFRMAALVNCATEPVSHFPFSRFLPARFPFAARSFPVSHFPFPAFPTCQFPLSCPPVSHFPFPVSRFSYLPLPLPLPAEWPRSLALPCGKDPQLEFSNVHHPTPHGDFRGVPQCIA